MLTGLIVAVMPFSLVTAKASATALPFGLFQVGNNLDYSFPVTPGYAIQYYGWQESFRTAEAQAAWDNGTETFAEMQTCGNPCYATGVPIADVINGTYDNYLTTFANSVKSFHHPVLITFDHEMNGGWYPWGDTEISPGTWIRAWQHVTSLISSIAPNVRWVWAPNVEQGARSFAAYWPGIGYLNPHVSVIGLDGYLGQASCTWANTFARSVTDAELASGGRYPFVVAETGVASTDPDSIWQLDDLVSGAKSSGAMALMYFDKGSVWSLTPAEQSDFIKDVR